MLIYMVCLIFFTCLSTYSRMSLILLLSTVSSEYQFSWQILSFRGGFCPFISQCKYMHFCIPLYDSCRHVYPETTNFLEINTFSS